MSITCTGEVGNTVIQGEEWDLYVVEKALRLLGFRQETACTWRGTQKLDVKLVYQLNKQAEDVLRPVIHTRCGICREVGHWRTKCPQSEAEQLEKQASILQHPHYKRFQKQCMCGPSSYPSLCLRCRFACCDEAWQPLAHKALFTCVIHGRTHKNKSLAEILTE